MWNQTDNQLKVGGGGFMNSPGQTGSPSLGGSAEKRPDRIQNVVPVHVSAVSSVLADQPLTVSGQEVHLAVLVGTVETIERAATKESYTLRDTTGAVTALRWRDADQGQQDADSDVADGMLCRMVVRVRPGKAGGAPAVMCLHLEPATAEQQQVHRLEVAHAALKIRHVAGLAGAAPAAAGGGLENSTLGGDVPMVIGGGIVGLTPQQQAVYAVIHACPDDQGVHRNGVYSGVSGKVPRPEVDRIIEFLSNEGHIFNTTDNDHFKATD